MQISLAGWAAKGLRCPDIEISLIGKTGKPAKVALVQMPNGTGKTTNLELIRATLTGAARQWTPEQIREMRRPGETHDKGQFRVTLLANDRPLTFELLLNFETGEAKYRTTLPSSGGVVPRWEPPAAIRQFLTPAFLDLFIFDGEFADELLKKGAGRADEAIGALCQLDLLGTVTDTAELEWRRRTSQGGPKSAAGLTKLNAERDLLIVQKAKLEQAREKAESKLAEDTRTAADLTKKITKRLSSVETTQAQHNEAVLAFQSAKAAVSNSSGAVMGLLRMPLALHPNFSETLVELKDNLDELKLPENTSVQFFNEIVGQPECICGREMNLVARDEILKRAKGYLDFEESGTINALKHDINRFVAAPGEESRHVQLERSISALTTASRQQRNAQQTLSSLSKTLIAAGDDELKGWETDLQSLENDMARCRQMLQDIDAPSEDETGGSMLSLKLVEKKIKILSSKIAELTDTVELKRKTDILNIILERSATSARDSIRGDLLRTSNERLSVVLANDPLRIDRIDQSLHLKNQSDASAGQKLSVGYSFLMSALSRGNNDFPLVIDSPAGKIDEGVRRNIGKLIPELCTQFVGFTINVERPGFVQALEKACDDCLFLTLFRRTEGTRRLEQDLPESGVTQTENATLVDDRDYFMTFDIAEEEEV